MYSSSYEVNTICRICLSEGTNLIDIFSSAPNIPSICLAVMECAPVLISRLDSLPHTICTHCVEKLEIACDFRILCVKSDQALRNNVSYTAVVKKENDSSDSKSELGPTDVIKREKGNNDDISIKNREIESVVKEEDNSYDEFPLDNSPIFSENEHKDISIAETFGIKTFADVRTKRVSKSNLFNLKDRKPRLDAGLIIPDEDGYYHCQQCTRSYKTKYNLKDHIKSHSNFRHQCDQCGKEFSCRKYLKYHMIVHTGERRFNCEFCGVLCRSKYHLRRHQTIHSSKREYKCKICEKEFKSKEQLRKHSVTHTDERPWICEKCGKGFKRKDHLVLHERTHGNKRFGCPQCSQTFLTRQNLNNHVLKHCSGKS